MFTPNRKRNSALPSSRRSATSLTPRAAALRNTSRASLVRRSFASKSFNAANTTLFGSPSLTTAFQATYHTLQSYESSMPVLVTEAITLAEDISEITVQISPIGWSWLVYKQTLFVWTHKQTGFSKNSICKELPLRSVAEDDCYSAELVSVDYDDDSGCVTAIAVSLLGKVIYWSNLLISTNPSTEIEVDLQSLTEQCFNVVSVQMYGYVLSTSFGSLIHLYSTQNTIVCKHMNPSTGTLAGIGRRVSSFFFSSTSQTNTVLQMFVTRSRVQGTFGLFILTQTSLQHWKAMFSGKKEVISVMQWIGEADIYHALISKLSQAIWSTNKTDLKLWPLDARQASKQGETAVLVAVTDSTDTDSSLLYYAVCVFRDLQNLDDINVIVFKYHGIYSKTTENNSLSFELVIENPMARFIDHFAIWCNDRVVLKTVSSNGEEGVEDDVEFNLLGDRLLGAGHCDGQCVFLSATNGLLSSCSSFESQIPLSVEESILNVSSYSPQMQPESGDRNQSIPGTPVMTKARMEQLESSENCAQRLQAAFLYYCRLNMEQAQMLIAEAFSSDDSSQSLDNAVVIVSANLLDDYPAQDPRWAESVPRDVASEYGGSTGSLILLHQLEDKQKAHSLYLKFLSEIGIWPRLGNLQSGRNKIVTRWLLHEHAEKLQAAINLLQKHPTYQGIVDAAILRVLDARGKAACTGGLTHRDFFYREVSRIEEVFEYLLEEEEKSLLNNSLSSRERAAIVSGVNSVITCMLSSARQYRRSQALAEEFRDTLERIPWTVKSRSIDIRNIVVEQHKFTIERGIPEAEDNQQRAVLHQSLVDLSDLVLETYQAQIASISLEARREEVQALYEKHRSQLICPLLTIGQREKATHLAEKYHDFNTLVTSCDETNDVDKMKTYIRKFAVQGYAEFLFSWYVERREFRKLLSSCDGDVTLKQKLRLFLQDHPRLAWMHQLRTGDYKEACDTLILLAGEEKESAANKKSYLSLGKLAAVFSDEETEMIDKKKEVLDREQMLLTYQETLPARVLEALKTSPDQCPVYSPSKLIELYVGEINEHSNEVDFKKAFELLDYLDDNIVEDDEMEGTLDPESWKLYVWCQAILKDGWHDVDSAEDPFVSCSNTVLFKTLKLAYDTNTLPDILPEVDALLRRPELDTLGKDPAFDYLMRASFERVQRMLVSSPE